MCKPAHWQQVNTHVLQNLVNRHNVLFAVYHLVKVIFLYLFLLLHFPILAKAESPKFHLHQNFLLNHSKFWWPGRFRFLFYGIIKLLSIIQSYAKVLNNSYFFIERTCRCGLAWLQNQGILSTNWIYWTTSFKRMKVDISCLYLSK